MAVHLPTGAMTVGIFKSNTIKGDIVKYDLIE